MATTQQPGPVCKFDAALPAVNAKYGPALAPGEWGAVFRSDPVILGKLIRDILLLGASDPCRPGRRTADADAIHAEGERLGLLG